MASSSPLPSIPHPHQAPAILRAPASHHSGQKETLGIFLLSQPLSLIKITSLADLCLLPGPRTLRWEIQYDSKDFCVWSPRSPTAGAVPGTQEPLEILLQSK